MLLATNKVNSTAQAYIDNVGLNPGAGVADVAADGAITVAAEDAAGIDAVSTMKAVSTTTNDAGLSMVGDLSYNFV